MPTRTQQGDIMLCAYASHGDTMHPLLLPANPKECFEMAVTAFDLSDRLQTPVFVLSDLDIGMNDWMIPELEWDDSTQPDRGKVLSSDDVNNLEKFYRYLDTDGDGIAARTLPGENPRGAYFVRGSGHNKLGFYTESSDEYKELVDRLLVKWKTAKTLVPKPVLKRAREETGIGIIAYGSSDGAVLEALDHLAAIGIHADYMRVLAFPFNGEVTEFVENHETVFVVEQNRDAQLRTLLILETNTDARKLVPVLHYNGMPIPSECVVKGLCEHLCEEDVA
jgi:2-oxoglutarate ferredoxin oxidoreductase subunit alpha